jgi:hypothetical protein
MSTSSPTPLQYIYLHTDNSDVFKKTKKKLSKTGAYKLFRAAKYNNAVQKTRDVHVLRTTLVNLSHAETRTAPLKDIGVLTDTNMLIDDIYHLMTLHDLPKDWDILCMDSQVASYDFLCEDNTVMWTRSVVTGTGHFVINKNSLGKVIPLLSNAADWTEFVKRFGSGSLRIFTRNGTPVSSPIGETLETTTAQLQKKSEGLLSFNQLMDKPFDENFEWPTVSLVSVLTDIDKIFHTVYSFLKIDYPKNKLELIIVDDTDSEKRLKRFIPEDPRIKVVKIPKSENSGHHLGYLLNAGVKYAAHDYIYHFLDTNHYFITYFRALVKIIMQSGKDIVLSKDHAGTDSQLSSYISITPSVCNMIYKRDYWKTRVFQYETLVSETSLIYNFIRGRWETAGWLPSLYFSFLPKEIDNHGTLHSLPFDLNKMVEAETKQSFDMVF